MAAHQAPPSLRFSRQEHWSGLPFPSPMHESEKWKGSRSVVSDSLRPHGLQSTRLLRPWDFPGKSTGVGCHCLLHLYHWVTYKPAKGNFWGRVRFWAVSQQEATFLGTGECVLNRKWKNLRNTAQQLLQYIKLKQCFRKKYLLLPWMVYSDIF